MTIGELLQHDFARPIEEIVKVNNTDEETVRTELTEYIATPKIREHYRGLLKAFAEAPSAPSEAAGVWISGFFGSGKSSFAKNLGYLLANRAVGGTTASALFTRQIGDERITHLVELINRTIPCQVFMFDVQTDLAIQTNQEQIALVMYQDLLRTLEYAEDYDLAELEIGLEAEGRLEAFEAACSARYGKPWQWVRKSGEKFSRASALLFDLDPQTYPGPDSWVQLQRTRPLQRLTSGMIVDRCFELCARRCPGKAFVFIIDEVGQYVATSSDKLESLRAVVEQFGRAGMERLKRKKIPGPAWIVVTSQEKLQEVCNFVASGRIDLPKLQDRFKYQIDLSPADIRQVATQRVLPKTKAGGDALRALYRQHQNVLKQSCKLERSKYSAACGEEDFVQFYPYQPHYIDLSIDIMTGIRQQPGAPRHVGGSNRTIIKQCYEMLMNPRTQMAQRPVGELVTIDKIYELVEGNLPSEKQKDIADIAARLDSDTDYPGWASRVAKAICLLEPLHGIPRTAGNLAALLVDRVGDGSPLQAVEGVLERLEGAQFIRATDEGWKLQTAQEKSWEEERRDTRQPNRSERAVIFDRVLKAVLDDARAGSYNFRDLRTFSVQYTQDGRVLTSPTGTAIPIGMEPVEADAEFSQREREAVAASLQDARQHEIVWLFPLEDTADGLVSEVHASERMIQKYQTRAAQQSVTEGEKGLLADERARLGKLEAKLGKAVQRGMEAGKGIFRGAEYAAGDLGDNFGAMIRGVCDRVVPELFAKAEMGCRPVGAGEAEAFLRRTDLQGLDAVYYDGAKGLELVVRQGRSYIANPRAPVAAEILDYLKAEEKYGNRVTGKQLLERFCGWGYGWEQEVIRLATAVLFRSGVIEVTHQSRRYGDYQEAAARAAFASTPGFRSSGFAPREAVELKDLKAAAENLELILGRHFNMEVGVLQREFQKALEADRLELGPKLAIAEQRGMVVAEVLREWRDAIAEGLAASADECARMLAGQGKSLAELRSRGHRICQAMTEANLNIFDQAEIALREELPALIRAGLDEEGMLATAGKEAQQMLASPDVLDEVGQLSKRAEAIDVRYRRAWDEACARRAKLYGEAIGAIEALPAFRGLDADEQRFELEPLRRRSAGAPPLGAFQLFDPAVGRVLGVLLDDLELLPTLRAGTETRLRQREAAAAAGGGGDGGAVEVLRLSDFFPLTAPLDTLSDADIEAALGRLREKLLSLRELKRRATWA